ncbi:MAG TPA: NUDIX hydrolase [Alphaproteobacteria bacterium]
MTQMSIVPIERLELTLTPQPWPFAEQRRKQIDGFFDRLRKSKPALWNGRVLMLGPHRIHERRFSGTFFETDYASMLAWKHWGFPDPGVTNCFAQGAVRSADGAFLLGVMAAHTANSGQIYFPSGTPDPDDVVGDVVDLEGSVWRELTEETGLAAAELVADPIWHAVMAGPQIVLMRILRSRENADDLRARILAYLARERQPELADIRIVRGPSDFDAMVLPFARAYLTAMWSKSE